MKKAFETSSADPGTSLLTSFTVNVANDDVTNPTTRRTEALGTTTRPGQAGEPELSACSFTSEFAL